MENNMHGNWPTNLVVMQPFKLSSIFRLILIISTKNLQSIKGKERLLLNHINENKMEVFVVTETWLTSDDKDIVLAKVSELNKNNYRLIEVSRIRGRGGALVIVYDSDLDMKLLSNSERNTFEFAIWRVKIENRPITIIGLHQQPPSNIIVHTNNQFIDNLLDSYESNVAEYRNIMISGHFSLHVKDNDNDDGLQFSNIIQVLGLKQWVNFPSHTKGNIIDLVLTEAICCFNITSVNQGHFLSDHCSVMTFMDYQKSKRLTELVSNWKLKDNVIGDFGVNLHIEEQIA